MSAGLLAPLVAAGVGAGCVAVAGAVAGGQGALGALIGVALVIGFLWSGIVPLLLIRDGSAATAKGLATGVLLLSYTLRLALALVVLKIAGDSAALSHRALGVTVIVTATAWTGAALVSGLGGEGHADPA